MLDHSVGSGKHTNADRAEDCYETPPEAVHALLKVEKLPHKIWEPACGSGNISKVLAAAGHEVVSSDLHDHGFGLPGIDFIRTTSAEGAEAVLTNPPYIYAHRFVTKALSLCPKVIMLLRLAFLESEKRRDILDEHNPVRIHVFRNRLPMMHRAGSNPWTGPKASSAIAFCWMVWERGYKGPTTIDRISWEKLP